MSIKAAGGVFGRNPTFNDVTVEGDLSIDGTLTIGGSVITGLNLQGNWNASTNTPDLTVLTPDAGKFWIVSVAGSTNLGGFTNWTVGDWALYDGTSWQRIEGGTVDLSNGVTGTLAIANGGTGATTAANARTALGSGAVGDNVFIAATASAAQQAMDVEVGVDVQAYDATILKSADIGVSVQGYDADTAKYDDVTANFTGTLQNGGSNVLVDTDIGSTVEAYDSTILKSADIGSSVQAYDADTAKYDDATANFTGTLQNGGSNVLVDTDIGSTVEAYDATILKSADIGSTVQGYDADTAKYDDTTANFTGTLQNGGSNVVVDTDIGSTVQAYDATILKSADIGSTVQGYDADTAKLDVAQTWTAKQTFGDTDVAGTEPVITLKDTQQKSWVSGDVVGAIDFYTADSSGLGARTVSSIKSVADENSTSSSGALVFSTAYLNTSAIQRMKIDSVGNVSISDGNLVIGTSGKGIDFSATAGTGTSELFDDYEEGVFEPSFGGSTSDPTVTYDNPNETSGIYRKIGSLVFFTLSIRTDSATGGSGALLIKGLPFTAASGLGESASCSVYVGFSSSFGTNPTAGTVSAGTTRIELRYRATHNANSSSSLVSHLSNSTNSNYIYLAGSYVAA